jgi:hypothetical protein
MRNAPANEFGSTYRPLSVPLPVRGLTAYLWRLFRVCIATTASQLRERALQRADRHSAMADRSFSRLHGDVLTIEARRLL